MKQIKYVPILKWKMGEQGALRELEPDITPSLLPILEVPARDYDFDEDTFKKTLEAHVEKMPLTISRSWNNLFYLDISNLDEHYLDDGTYLYDHLDSTLTTSEYDINFIPVYIPTCPLRNNSYFGSCIRSNRTIGIRLKFNDIEDMEQTMQNVMSELNIIPDEMHNIDLIIDFGYINPSDESRMFKHLKLTLSEIPNIHFWRFITLAGTSFPENLSEISSGNSMHIRRSFYHIYHQFINSHKYRRDFLFGDYAIANPIALDDIDPRFLTPSCNIRYTVKDSYFIVKGRSFKKFGGTQHRQLCSILIATPGIYFGNTFSAGDKYIDDCYKNTVSPGNLCTWRRIGTNHHITLVVNQLSNLL